MPAIKSKYNENYALLRKVKHTARGFHFNDNSRQLRKITQLIFLSPSFYTLFPFTVSFSKPKFLYLLSEEIISNFYFKQLSYWYVINYINKY